MNLDRERLGLPWRVVAATGPRLQNLSPAGREWVRPRLRAYAKWLRDECGTTIGLSGFAIGVDLWWADAVHAAGLTLGAHTPCPGPHPRWSSGDQDEYRRLLALADPEWSWEHAPGYTASCMNDRNEGMLRAADAGLYVWDQQRRRGGTWDAVQRARRMGLPGIWLDPAVQVSRFIYLPKHADRIAAHPG